MTIKAQTCNNIKATIVVDRQDWHIISRNEQLSSTPTVLQSQGLNSYGSVLTGIMLPIYKAIGQDRLIAAYKADPKNGIRNLIHEYMLQRKREKNE